MGRKDRGVKAKKDGRWIGKGKKVERKGVEGVKRVKKKEKNLLRSDPCRFYVCPLHGGLLIFYECNSKQPKRVSRLTAS